MFFVACYIDSALAAGVWRLEAGSSGPEDTTPLIPGPASRGLRAPGLNLEAAGNKGPHEGSQSRRRPLIGESSNYNFPILGHY